MTTLREAAQQALEALEGWENHDRWVWPESALEQAKRNTTEAITALKAALAEPEKLPMVEIETVLTVQGEPVQNSQDFGVAGSATSLWRESAAQGCSPGGTGMPATPPQRPAEPVQEPVATVVACQYEDGTHAGNALDWAGRNCENDFPIGTKFYTAPPQHKPLTDEEIWRTYKNLWVFHPAEEPRLAGDVLKFARAIERAHGIGGQDESA